MYIDKWKPQILFTKESLLEIYCKPRRPFSLI